MSAALHGNHELHEAHETDSVRFVQFVKFVVPETVQLVVPERRA